jgi:hypothetical protein
VGDTALNGRSLIRTFGGLLALLLTGFILAFSPRLSIASDIETYAAVRNTDYIAAGYGGMRGIGTGTITVAGVSGTVTRALLYWHGPTNSSDPAANAAISFAGSNISGTNIGFSSDNCWSFTNSQAYRADVTSLVSGNGSYSLRTRADSTADINGASLLVFFNDADTSNNRDIVLFNGNDSNIDNPFDALGWNVVLPGVTYSSGAARAEFHVSDGQFGPSFVDGEVFLNGSSLIPQGQIFSGDSVPNGASAATTAGGLWDIKSYEITSFLTPGDNTLRLTSQVAPGGDCLSLIVAAINLPAGAAPPGIPDPGQPQPEPPAQPVAPGAPNPALVTVTHKATPNHAAAANSVVTFNLVATNRGEGAATRLTMELPYASNEVQVLDATFSRSDLWVSALDQDSVTVQSGRSLSSNETVTATLRLAILPTVAVGTSLSDRVTFRWGDRVDGGNGVSNLPILVVGSAADDRTTYALASSAEGDIFGFASTIYGPKEPIGLWYNTPDGQAVTVGNIFADPSGAFAVAFDASGLPAGTYSMVAYGNWSGFTSVTTFVVQ